MELRPYQAQAISDVRRAIARGSKTVCVVAPTGAGKTVIAAHIIRSAVAKGKRCAFVAHRAELLAQTCRTLESLGVEATIVAPDCPPRPAAVQVCSTQTLVTRGQVPRADVVIVDEAHHYASGSPEWSGILSSWEDSYIIGFTATPSRADGSPLGEQFAELVVAANYSELLADGRLVHCEVVSPAQRLESAISMPPYDAWRQYAEGRPTALFLPTVQMARDLQLQIGSSAVAVWGDMPRDDRTSAIERFARGDANEICSVAALTEGWDAPRCEVAILARSASHVSTYLQIVGRILRPAARKRTPALLVDLVGAYHEHGHPTLDRVYSLDGKPIRLKEPPPACWHCRRCGLVVATRPPTGTCPRCSAELPPPRVPDVAGESMARQVAWRCPSCLEDHHTLPLTCHGCGHPTPRHERVSSESPELRAAYLERMRSIARERGYNPLWAVVKYRAKYGVAP